MLGSRLDSVALLSAGWLLAFVFFTALPFPVFLR
jgi:hypothetical protein